MKTVWKYAIVANEINNIELPIGAKVLSAQLQFDVLQMWVLVDPNETKRESRLFNIFCTGESINNDSVEFIGTFQAEGGSYVFHLFEIVIAIPF